MLEVDVRIAERHAILDQRLADSFEVLFPKIMLAKRAVDSGITPYKVVEQRRLIAKGQRGPEKPEPTMEEALWLLISEHAEDPSGFVSFNTILAWGERYGADGEFDANEYSKKVEELTYDEKALNF